MTILAEHTTTTASDAPVDAEAGASDSWGTQVHGANVGFDAVDFSDGGAVGHPTNASREAGEELFDRATDELAALVDWRADRDVDALWSEENR